MFFGICFTLSINSRQTEEQSVNYEQTEQKSNIDEDAWSLCGVTRGQHPTNRTEPSPVTALNQFIC